MTDRLSEHVSYEVVDGVAVIRTDNPPVNALGNDVRAGIFAGIERFDADPDAKGFEGVCTSGRSLSELLAGSVGLLLVIGAIVAFFYILFYVALVVSGTTTRIL